MTDNLTDEQRKDRRVQIFIRAGMSISDAHLIDDLGRHAADEALEAVFRVQQTAPLHLQAGVLLFALRFLSVNTTEALAEIYAKEKS